MLLKEIEKEAVSNEAASFSISTPKKNQAFLCDSLRLKIIEKNLLSRFLSLHNSIQRLIK